MGGVPSTPRGGNLRQEDAEYLIGEFVGNRAYPVSSDFWQKLLDLSLTVQWPHDRILHACEMLAQNNHHTRHLGKVLIHLVLCLQDSMSSSTASSASYKKAVNATYISSVFLKYIIENSKSEKFEDLCLSFDEDTKIHATSPTDQSIESFFMRGVLSYIGASDVSPHSCLLHHELLNLMFVAMSTQLRSGPSPGTKDVHPFIDAAMIQESTVVAAVVRRLLLNFIMRPRVPFNGSNYPVFPEGSQPGVLQRVSSAAANFVLLPYYTFNYLVSSSGEGLRSPLADKSLLLLLILVHYRKCVIEDASITKTNVEAIGGNSYMKETYFCENPYCKALNSVRDVEFDRVDIEGNAQSGPVVRLPFASLFDTLGLCLDGESSVLLLYSLVHGNSDFLEYVLVRTDLDTLLMPILETLYNASKRTPNQIYMLLIVLLILSQDSSFNASIHKLILQSVPWYQERLLHKTSLGSLMVVILIRTVKYNLSKLRDVYLHTNCLAILANMAPHVHKLSAYASQRLVSLFDMLSRKYIKLTDIMDDSVLKIAPDQFEGNVTKEDMSPELHIYTDFLRIVLEIFNAILTYALPRNPEVVYAIMHRQEVFQPFKNHPRFNELIENIYTVLDFFNSRMDMQQMEGEWSVDKVLQVIITNCRSWRGEGMKMFNQLRFTYEQESHPEEFFIPYVWRLVVFDSFSFNLDAITLFPIDQPVYETQSGELDV
ncbi:dymeclin [Dioscorea cayenensis subsp. rotundata]|uniref:Dymeclin n=1 Tax=Dioscorea cayennensis subsp. rotundata TaxID=55577 RepID=A0AB40BVQ7_DIOCR|nr:dymeclin [Dioscorea cayenensis subsp. rotundata]